MANNRVRLAVILIICCSALSCITLPSATLDSTSTTLKEAVSPMDYGLLTTLPEAPISYQKTIRPILANRCVTCHACYDAPCQLKLSSASGILRGASKTPVYASRRILAEEPTRLGIDAKTQRQWRDKGFHSVLSPTALATGTVYQHPDTQQAIDNLQQSLLYQFIRQKSMFPQPQLGKLSDKFPLSINSKWQCPTTQESAHFFADNQQFGMPYALPNLSSAEYEPLVQWIAQGSPMETSLPLADEIKKTLAKWEDFFNQPSLKQQLMSRYIYEHLFLGHIYFQEHVYENQQPQFFRLIRSKTPKGQTIDEIATRRPYDDPKTKRFYYRFKAIDADMVLKTSRPYLLSDDKMQRYRQLFLTPQYTVNAKHFSYKSKEAANPFYVFQDIPAHSRYQFMLDNAYFIIDGFIKGSVCRGQVALNVIDDYFWLVFFSPDSQEALINPDFIKQQIPNLTLPAEQGNSLNLLSVWNRYWDHQKQYTDEKYQFLASEKPQTLKAAIAKIWDGQQRNESAHLTIFRHTDSSSLNKGLIGDKPSSILLLDYPLLERIHYLLVAGFDVFGNIGHQLNTRLYMDFLRIEGEDNFLTYLDLEQRKLYKDSWYQGIRKRLNKQFEYSEKWLAHHQVKSDENVDSIDTLYALLKQRPLSSLTSYSSLKQVKNPQLKHQLQQLTEQVNHYRGEQLKYIPDISFIRITESGEEIAPVFSLVHHKAYEHLSSMFQEDEDDLNRDYQRDSISLLDWLEGAYPDFFLQVPAVSIAQFRKDFMAIKDSVSYEFFVERYGVRRSNPEFWSVFDKFSEQRKKQDIISAGIYDLNRYENK